MTATASRSTCAGCSEGRIALIALALLVLPGAAWAEGARTVVGSAHDLSARGGVPGGPQGATGSDVCIHCHTGHLGRAQGPLWSRKDAPRVYVPYSSDTMDARTGQPDGASKLCLSCHDGAIASNTIAAAASPRRPPVVLAPGSPFAPPDRAPSPVVQAIGPDLSDDHPVSFVYDAGLAMRDGLLAVPEQTFAGTGRTIAHDMLDRKHKVQCTSCHDAHDNGRGAFLRLPQEDGRLCTTCHVRRGYEASAHSEAGSPAFRGSCTVCHVQHGAARSSPLLVRPERDLCGHCHPKESTAMRPGAPTAHGARGRGEPLSCSTCHDPHLVRQATPFDRQILTDPDDRIRPAEVLSGDLVPVSYRTDPRRARDSGSEFCMDCHDGTWVGAVNLSAELSSRRVPQTDFRIDSLGLHATHARSRGSSTGVGCTYCHDPHGTGGNRGVPRRALLYEWITVADFPYRGRRSCSTSDVLGACHSAARR